MEFKVDKLLHENLVASAEKWPKRIAFKFAANSLTFLELHHESDKLACFLINRNIGRDCRVAILMNRSLETAIAVYGILKSGAAYVPIDPTAPQTRVISILKNCDITHMITEPGKARDVHVLAEAYTPLECVIGCNSNEAIDVNADYITWDGIAELGDATFESPRIEPEDVAYIMFTSGSTGIPKGIVHCHRSGQAYARLTQDLFQIDHLDCIANHAPLHFDICTLGYFTAPRAGATTLIIPEPHTRMPASMAKLAADEKVTIWYSVPFALIQMLTRGALEQLDFSALRMVQYGGDPFSPRQVRELMNIWPGVEFFNIYGPAETNQCMWYRVPDDSSGIDSATPIGTLLVETMAQICRDDGGLVEPGEIGELFIHSSTMMQGYWRNQSLNRTCFVESEVRWYRTGDLASIDESGLYHYHGRKDRRVKVRGNRIELDEIEAASCKYSPIEEAAAYLMEAGSEQEHIELAILGNGEASESLVADLRQHLQATLSKFAVPDSIIIFDEFPRTTSGKIDRNRIRLSRCSE